jgi:hypothetical protein
MVDAWCLKEWGVRCFAPQSQKYVSNRSAPFDPHLDGGTDSHFPEPTALRIQGRSVVILAPSRSLETSFPLSTKPTPTDAARPSLAAFLNAEHHSADFCLGQ